jgi:hypothetical protein
MIAILQVLYEENGDIEEAPATRTMNKGRIKVVGGSRFQDYVRPKSH